MTTGYVSLDVVLIIAMSISALSTFIGITYPICRKLGIMYEDGVIEFGNSDISLRISPKIKFEKYTNCTEENITGKTIYN